MAPASADFCYDTSSLLPKRLPLAAPALDSCTAASAALSPASSLLVFGRSAGLSQGLLRSALGLSERIVIGQFDALTVRRVVPLVHYVIISLMV